MGVVLLAVFVGGGLGALSRYGVGLWIARAAAEAAFPWATWLVNVAGSFVLGFLAIVLIARVPDLPALRIGVMTGFLGGLTTFSTFSVEAVTLLSTGQVRTGLAYLAGNVGLGLLAAWAGMALGRAG